MPAHRAGLDVAFGDEAVARAVEGALAVEAADGPEGSRVSLERHGPRLALAVEAPSVSDLRAALNSLIRLLDAAERVALLAPGAPRTGRETFTRGEGNP